MITKLSATQFSQRYGRLVPGRLLIMRDRSACYEVSMISLDRMYVVGIRGLVYPFVEFYCTDSIEDAYECYKDCRETGGVKYA